MAHTSVPIIDIAPFLEGTVTGKRHVAAKVGRACEEIGFLTIVGHGVPADLVQRTYDISGRFFDEKIDPPLSFMRVINYPDQPDDPLPGQLRAGAHSDYGTLTILRSENVAGGLQVRDRAGEWIDVVTLPESFVINIGDMMQYWTNDRWISTVHRVVNPPRDTTLGSRRQSIVFFHSPNENTLISCLDSCSSADNPPKYPPVLAGEHLRQKSEKAGTRPEAETKA